MKNLAQFIFTLFLIISSSVWAGSNKFCQGKFGKHASLILVPLEAQGKIAVQDGVYGSKSTETNPVVSPSGFICFISLGYEEKKCRDGMKLDSKLFGKRSCISKEFSFDKLCPNEIKNYPDLNSSEICSKK
ncbi:MAG: hypothetical protein COT73_01125 [Bdellovibrio sp. CG10_big_fil_rev_8_21_14_0_10_47_8]|nr:MAG: hypothetical protein COT73_01125 [Bdellovibrio sp. CG10_big_fil_rev_8_21_14_0_10_47_8]